MKLIQKEFELARAAFCKKYTSSDAGTYPEVCKHTYMQNATEYLVNLRDQLLGKADTTYHKQVLPKTKYVINSIQIFFAKFDIGVHLKNLLVFVCKWCFYRPFVWIVNLSKQFNVITIFKDFANLVRAAACTINMANVVKLSNTIYSKWVFASDIAVSEYPIDGIPTVNCFTIQQLLDTNRFQDLSSARRVFRLHGYSPVNQTLSISAVDTYVSLYNLTDSKYLLHTPSNTFLYADLQVSLDLLQGTNVDLYVIIDQFAPTSNVSITIPYLESFSTNCLNPNLRYFKHILLPEPKPFSYILFDLLSEGFLVYYLILGVNWYLVRSNYANLVHSKNFDKVRFHLLPQIMNDTVRCAKLHPQIHLDKQLLATIRDRIVAYMPVSGSRVYKQLCRSRILQTTILITAFDQI